MYAGTKISVKNNEFHYLKDNKCSNEFDQEGCFIVQCFPWLYDWRQVIVNCMIVR